MKQNERFDRYFDEGKMDLSFTACVISRVYRYGTLKYLPGWLTARIMRQRQERFGQSARNTHVSPAVCKLHILHARRTEKAQCWRVNFFFLAVRVIIIGLYGAFHKFCVELQKRLFHELIVGFYFQAEHTEPLWEWNIKDCIK